MPPPSYGKVAGMSLNLHSRVPVLAWLRRNLRCHLIVSRRSPRDNSGQQRLVMNVPGRCVKNAGPNSTSKPIMPIRKFEITADDDEEGPACEA